MTNFETLQNNKLRIKGKIFFFLRNKNLIQKQKEHLSFSNMKKRSNRNERKTRSILPNHHPSRLPKRLAPRQGFLEERISPFYQYIYSPIKRKY